jgi:hypothetical protein
VEQIVATVAMMRLFLNALRIYTFPESFTYQAKVNPFQTALSLDSLKEKIIKSMMGA